MSNGTQDRNLLVGILALQMDFISQSQLILGMQKWLLDKSGQLEDLLMHQGAITEEKRDFLRSIAQQHMKLYNQDAGKSLASLSSISSARRHLECLGDEDIEKTLSLAAHLRQQQNLEAASVLHIKSTLLMPDVGHGSQRFRILRPHAKGGLGVVSVAEDTELHREVALKEIQSQFSEDVASRNRFLIEAEITGRLEHPGIVPVYSLGHSNSGDPFYVMRFIRGDSLKDAIIDLYSESAKSVSKELQSQSLRRLIKRLVDVCNAVEYAHSRGVLHRDLKPGNIMLGKYGETLVVDWGLAKTVGRKGQHENSDEPTMVASSGEGSSQTRMGTVVGTLAYMSPEQAAGRLDELGPASDVYCLGGTLYCMLTGRAPIDKASTEEMLRDIAAGNIKPVRQLNPVIDPALAAICGKALALKRGDRYESCAALAEELERWLADEPVEAYPEPLQRRLSRKVRKHKSLVTTTFAVLFVATLSLLFINRLVTRQNIDLRIARDLAENNRVLAAEGQTKAVEKLGVARSVTLNLVQIAETVLSQNDAFRNLRESTMDDAFKLFMEIHQDSPDNLTVAEQLAKVSRIAGNQKGLLVKLDEAEVRLNASLAAQKLLQKGGALTDEQESYFSETYRDLGKLFSQQGRLTESIESLKNARQVLANVSPDPTNNELLRSAAWIDNDQVKVLMDLWRLDEALNLAMTNEETFRRLLDVEDKHDLDRTYLVFALYRQGRCLDYLDRTDEAMVAYDKAILEARKPYEQSGRKNFPADLVRSLIWSAEARSRTAPARPNTQEHITEAQGILEPLAKKTSQPQVLFYWAELLVAEAQFGIANKELDQGRAKLELAVPVLKELIAKNDLSYYSSKLSTAYSLLSDIERAANNVEIANQSLRDAVSHAKHAAERSPQNKELVVRLQRIQQKAKENGAL